MLASIWLHLVELWTTIADASVLLWGVVASFFCSALSTITASFKSGSAFNWLRKLINVIGLNIHRAGNADDAPTVAELDRREKKRHEALEKVSELAGDLQEIRKALESANHERQVIEERAKKEIEEIRQKFQKMYDDGIAAASERIKADFDSGKAKVEREVRALKAANTRLKKSNSKLLENRLDGREHADQDNEEVRPQEESMRKRK